MINKKYKKGVFALTNETNKTENKNLDLVDVENNKIVAALAYIIFFIPLLVSRDSKFATYHANQGLLIFIASIIINIVGAIIPILGWLIIIPFGNLAIIALVIIGIVNALKGLRKPLPLIGGIEIIK